MYFYDSNKGISWYGSICLFVFSNPFMTLAVGGCGFKDANDPGNLQFDWLEVQLKTYRRRKMQVCQIVSTALTLVICFGQRFG